MLAPGERESAHGEPTIRLALVAPRPGPRGAVLFAAHELPAPKASPSGALATEGGSGDDMFYFGDQLGFGNVDTIVDFNRHDERILLDHDVFLGLSEGSLQSSAFKTLDQDSRADSNDRILYDARTGDLFFD